MRNKNLKPFFNLVGNLIRATFDGNKSEIDSLLKKQDEMIEKLKPREYYIYYVTLAATNRGLPGYRPHKQRAMILSQDVWNGNITHSMSKIVCVYTA